MKDNQRIFFLLFGFFVVVALGSLIVLDGRGSAFERGRDSMGSSTAVLSKTTVIGDDSNAVPRENADQADDLASVLISIEVPDEVVEEAITEATFEPEEETAADEASLEISKEPAPEASSEYEVRYFTFKVNTKTTILRLREEPSEDAEIKAKLGMQSIGYVLKPGNEWCKVYTASGKYGYCATEYLLLEEATIDEYPAKVRDQVEAPDEELNY